MECNSWRNRSSNDRENQETSNLQNRRDIGYQGHPQGNYRQFKATDPNLLFVSSTDTSMIIRIADDFDRISLEAFPKFSPPRSKTAKLGCPCSWYRRWPSGNSRERPSAFINNRRKRFGSRRVAASHRQMFGKSVSSSEKIHEKQTAIFSLKSFSPLYRLFLSTQQFPPCSTKPRRRNRSKDRSLRFDYA